MNQERGNPDIDRGIQMLAQAASELARGPDEDGVQDGASPIEDTIRDLLQTSSSGVAEKLITSPTKSRIFRASVGVTAAAFVVVGIALLQKGKDGGEPGTRQAAAQGVEPGDPDTGKRAEKKAGETPTTATIPKDLGTFPMNLDTRFEDIGTLEDWRTHSVIGRLEESGYTVFLTFRRDTVDEKQIDRKFFIASKEGTMFMLSPSRKPHFDGYILYSEDRGTTFQRTLIPPPGDANANPNYSVTHSKEISTFLMGMKVDPGTFTLKEKMETSMPDAFCGGLLLPEILPGKSEEEIKKLLGQQIGTDLGAEFRKALYAENHRNAQK